MGDWKKTKINQFLFEREGKYQPDDKAVSELKRINKIDFSGNFHIVVKPSNTNMILIRPGDLVISGINVSKGAMGIYNGKEDVTATIHYSSYTFDTEKINVGYFKRFLKSPEFGRLLLEQVKGGIKTEIKPKHILPLEVALPDIEEQGKIVSHFKNIETEDGELKQELTHQKILLKKLRQQILQEAIEGKLTADWRERNPDVEPAGALLKRIQAEKVQLIKDKKIKKQKPLPPISEKEKPFDLPEGWEWCRLGEIKFTQTGTTPPTHDKNNYGDFIPFVQPADIKVFGEIDYNVKKLSKGGLNNGRLINSGSVLMVCIGGSIGKSAINLYEVSCNQQINTITPLAKIDPVFLQEILQSPYFQLSVWGRASGGTTPIVNKTKWEIIPVTLPPLPEQKAIVAKVEKLLAICDQLETQITANQAHAEQLMQSVLKETFQQNNSKPATRPRSD